jgi:cell division protease FtsH
MKFFLFVAATLGLLLPGRVTSFAPLLPILKNPDTKSLSKLSMAVDIDVPVIHTTSYGPANLRYSDFLKLVDANKVEKVSFSADGTNMLGVDVHGTRFKIEALPNDPDLLTQLTEHKVRL